MIYINYNNLDEETQLRLMSISKEDIENRLGEELKAYAKEHHIEYEDVLGEEATRNLYNYQYIFNI